MAFTIAADMAKYLYKQDEARRKIVTFSTDIQGLVPQFLDKIIISHSAVQWGEASMVVSRSVDTLTLSQPIEVSVEPKQIVFRNIDGSASDAYDITVVDEYTVTVVGMPVWVDTGIFVTILDADSAKEFLVIAVKPSGDKVQVDCVNYDASIYE